MLKGRKQIDGTFVDSRGRVVDTIKASELADLYGRVKDQAETIARLTQLQKIELEEVRKYKGSADICEEALLSIRHIVMFEWVLTNDKGSAKVFEEIQKIIGETIDKRRARHSPAE